MAQKESGKPKRQISPEHKQKLIDGRKKYWEDRKAKKAERPSDRSPAPEGSPAPATVVPKQDFVFFGRLDKDDKGKIKSDYPAWYFDVLKDNLRESIREKEDWLERELVPRDEIPVIKDQLATERAKYDEIVNMKPKWSGNQKDKIAKTRQELGSMIRDAMFTRSDMMKGIADAHEEARRMSEPVIELNSDMCDMAQACNIPMEGKMVSRTSAEKIWKILGKALGEGTNTEVLRRD